MKTTFQETLVVGLWLFIGALALWGFDQVGLLPVEKADLSNAFGPRVDFPQVVEIWQDGEAIFVDARPHYAFARGHISGAINVPINNVADAISRLPEDRSVRLITYCGSSECPNGWQLMKLLAEYGYQNVQLFYRGMESWRALGYPVEKQ